MRDQLLMLWHALHDEHLCCVVRALEQWAAERMAVLALDHRGMISAQGLVLGPYCWFEHVGQ